MWLIENLRIRSIDASKKFKFSDDVKSGVTEIVLVRHGETTWNAAGRIQGQIESDLNEVGLKQAVAVKINSFHVFLLRYYIIFY